eukprot:SAG11_NODE_2039_length_3892_cov_1.839705_3_plen_49_part_00
MRCQLMCDSILPTKSPIRVDKIVLAAETVGDQFSDFEAERGVKELAKL